MRGFLELRPRVLLPALTPSASETTTSTLSARGTGFKGLGLVNGQFTTVQVLAVPHFYRFLGFLIGRHFNETETAGPARHFVHDDARGRDRSCLRKRSLEFILRCGIGQTSYI